MSFCHFESLIGSTLSSRCYGVALAHVKRVIARNSLSLTKCSSQTTQTRTILSLSCQSCVGRYLNHSVRHCEQYSVEWAVEPPCNLRSVHSIEHDTFLEISCYHTELAGRLLGIFLNCHAEDLAALSSTDTRHFQGIKIAGTRIWL
jgi:hypothetical protein